jgi:hypothetical protein
MTNLTEEIKAMRATKLKVGVLSYLAKSRSDMRYVNTTRLVFRWATDEEFTAAINTLVSQNFITQTEGRQGGPRLTLLKGESHE